jgi:hypothetical protein
MPENEVIEENPVVEEAPIDESPVEEVEEVEEEVEVRPVQNSQAQALWDLLNSPATAKSTLQTIAQNLGLTIAESRTPEAKIAIRDVIKTALGEDLAFLGDKLGPLGDAIEQLIDSKTAQVEQKAEERHREQEAAKFSSNIREAMVTMDKTTKGEFSALLPAINKLMDEMPMGKQSPDQYLNRLYKTAKSEAADLVKTASEKRISTAAREANKTALHSAENPERVLKGSSKNPSYREAILQAMRDSNRK